MENCIFCKIVAKEIPAEIVFENDNWLAFLDIKPVNLGHTLLIPKAHHKNLFDLPENSLTEVGPLLQKIGQAVKEGTSADGLNLAMNNEAAAGQLVWHTHFHLMPRFASDGFEHWHGQENLPKEAFSETALKIKKLI